MFYRLIIVIIFAFPWSSVRAERCCLGLYCKWLIACWGNGICDDLAYEAISKLVVFSEDMLQNLVPPTQLSAALFLQCYFHICAITLNSELKCQAMSHVIKTFLMCCFSPSDPHKYSQLEISSCCVPDHHLRQINRTDNVPSVCIICLFNSTESSSHSVWIVDFYCLNCFSSSRTKLDKCPVFFSFFLNYCQ